VAEDSFERAANEFGDVKLDDRSIAERVKSELFEMRQLVIGTPVPDIVGEDLDGKTFRLSNYRGKVVVLDFWGHW
jgi:hypothetical protein